MTAIPAGVAIRLRVVPRASRTELAGTAGDALRMRVAAPPVEGAANAEVVRFLAELLEVPRSRVRLVRGSTGRTKLVEVGGIAAGVARARLGLYDAGAAR